MTTELRDQRDPLSRSICATRAPEMPRISPASRVENPSRRRSPAARLVDRARSDRSASSVERCSTRRTTSEATTAGRSTSSTSSIPAAARSSTSRWTASALRACRWQQRASARRWRCRVRETGRSRRARRGCMSRRTAWALGHALRDPPRSHARPSAGSTCRSMLRSVPVGMSREWIGTMTDEPSCNRHFWCDPS